METNNALVIETHGLSKSYKNVQALKSLDLKVAQHSIFGFLGPNCAGKTTAIKLLLGLSRPTGGNGSIFGCDIQRQSVEIRQQVGYLAQENIWLYLSLKCNYKTYINGRSSHEWFD